MRYLMAIWCICFINFLFQVWVCAFVSSDVMEWLCIAIIITLVMVMSWFAFKLILWECVYDGVKFIMFLSPSF